MNSIKLAKFLTDYVPIFVDIEVLEAGTAYHYTAHSESIKVTGRFLGAEINENLDQTQTTIPSIVAKSDPGIVFAYEHLHEALEESMGHDIVMIKYEHAVRATHSQEAALGAPPTVLIINRAISEFTVLDKIE